MAWWVSRIYLPLGFLIAYRQGHFSEAFHYSELIRVARITINVYLINLSGYFYLRYYCDGIMKSHVGYSEKDMAKKAMKDFLLTKNYLKDRQSN